jgi:vacuolar protein sorting-associated protein 13A/C
VNADIQARTTSISPGSNPLSIRVSAPERLEVNLTSAFVELAITSMTLWSKHMEKTNEERGDDAPFKLRNYTGLTMLVWPESRDLNKPVQGVKSIEDGKEFPWRFENAAKAREVSLRLLLKATSADSIRMYLR